MVIGKIINRSLSFFLLIAWLIGLPLPLQGQAAWQDVLVSTAIDQQNIIEDQPVKVLISITHNQSAKVDIASFRLGGKKAEIKFLQDVKISAANPLVISQYTLNLLGQPPGLYELPEVSVNVGGKVYTSVASTYQVEAKRISAPPPSPAAPAPMPAPPTAIKAPVAPPPSSNAKKNTLQLKLDLNGIRTLYPGQRFTVTYKYIFNDNIELSVEKLSLLETTDFLQIGTKSEKTYEQGDFSVQQISQTFEAVKPGEYKFEPSVIEGYVYRTDAFGKRTYVQPALRAEAPGMTLTVKPFPEKGKPTSFNGAIGPFDNFTATLKSPQNMNVGDKIDLEITIGGSGQLDNAHLPELCCQPGFSGVFQLNDLPPSELIKGNSKVFTVQFRPLIANVKAIPSIEFSYFDPSTEQYGTLHSKPIPITVNPIAPSEPQTPSQPMPSEKQPSESWKAASHQLQEIEISGNMPMKASDLRNYIFGSWWVLFLIPLGIILILLQWSYRNYLQRQRSIVKPKESRDYLAEALRLDTSSGEFYQLLQKALMMRLAEKKLIKSSDINIDKLPQDGLTGEVRKALTKIEEMKYAGKKQDINQANIQEAIKLFDKIGEVK